MTPRFFIKSAKTSTPADKAASVIFIPKQPTQGDRPWRTQRKRSKPLSPTRTVESDIHCFNRFENLSDSEDCNDPDFQSSRTCPSTDSDSGLAGQQQPSKRRKPTRIKEGNHNAHHVQLEKNSWTPVFKMSQIFAFLAQDRVIMIPLFRKTRLCLVLLILGKIALE